MYDLKRLSRINDTLILRHRQTNKKKTRRPRETEENGRIDMYNIYRWRQKNKLQQQKNSISILL